MAQGMRKVVRPTTAAVLRNTMFWFSKTFAGVGVGAVVSDSIQIQADAHFVCVMTMYDATTLTPFGGALVQITDGSSGRSIMTEPVPASVSFGTAQRPFVWPYTHLFRANAFIGLQVTNQAAGANTIRLAFAGYKIPVGAAAM
jgi:hypothetical protein